MDKSIDIQPTAPFPEWIAQLKAVFARVAPQAGNYVDDTGVESWREDWADGHTPESAAAEDMYYWEE